MSKNIVGIENVYEAKYVKSNKTMDSTEQKKCKYISENSSN